MSVSQETLEEIRLLSQFNLSSMSVGIKVHTSQAPDETVKAAERLFKKGLIDHVDGGYLTHRGVEAAERAQGLVGLLCE